MSRKKSLSLIKKDDLEVMLKGFANSIVAAIEQKSISTDLMKDMAMIGMIPNAIVILVDLMAIENDKKQVDEHLMEAYLLMFANFLAEISYLEDREGQNRQDEVEEKMLDLINSDKLSSRLLFMMFQAYHEVNLDVGDKLRQAFEKVFQSEAGQGDTKYDMSSSGKNPFSEILDSVDGDVFALSEFLLESVGLMPAEEAVQLFPIMLLSEEEPLREAVLACLLSKDAFVRESLIGDLQDASLQGAITPVMLRRMISIRNWLPSSERSKLDEVIKTCRKNGVACEPWPKVTKIREIWTSGIDGAGALTLIIIAKEGRRHAFTSLLVKQGKGVRDIMVMHQKTLAEIREVLDVLKSELFLFKTDMDFVEYSLRRFLSLNIETGKMPSYGLLELAETIGLSDLNPDVTSTQEMVNELYEVTTQHINKNDITGMLERSHLLLEEQAITDSWFIDNEELNKIKKRKISKEKKAQLLLDGDMEKQRDWWVGQFAWLGMALLHSGLAEGANREDNFCHWMNYIVVAKEILEGTALKDIPAMDSIAKTSLDDIFFFG